MERRILDHLAPAIIDCDSAAFALLSAEILQSGRSLRFQARGGSMAPLVRDGDVLLVAPVDSHAVRMGDLVLFRGSHGNVVVHRVIRVENGAGGRRFTLQGDAVSLPDGVVLGADIYGRVTEIERSGIRIVMDRPVMQAISCLAALGLRCNFGRWASARLVFRLARRLPVVSKYLA